MKKVGRILVGASFGGHWEQLSLIDVHSLVPGDLVFAFSTVSTAPLGGSARRYWQICDCNLHRPVFAMVALFQALLCVCCVRPRALVTTGALPGLLCVLVSRLLGVRTIWIDSIANGERLSACGRVAERLSHRVLTQWPELADGCRVQYRGAIL